MSVVKLLQALSAVESGDNDSAVGANGERGRYQISESVWADHLNVSFERFAHDKMIATSCAMKHLEWLANRFVKLTHRHPSPQDLYAMWNLGLSGYGKYNYDISKVPHLVRQRCIKFNNLLK